MALLHKSTKQEIDYNKLAQAMLNLQIKTDKEELVAAIVEANKEIENQKILKQKADLEEWHKVLGISDEDSEKKANRKIFFKLFTIKKKDAINIAANITLLKTLLEIVYTIFQIFIFVLIIGFAVSAISSPSILSISSAIGFFIIGIIFWRIIKIAKYEVENMQDKSFLIAVLSSLLSVIAVVISVITIASK